MRAIINMAGIQMAAATYTLSNKPYHWRTIQAVTKPSAMTAAALTKSPMTEIYHGNVQ
jgi:hypothetical protein